MSMPLLIRLAKMLQRLALSPTIHPTFDGFVARRRCHYWLPFLVVCDAVFDGKFAVPFTNRHLVHGSLL